jgi:Bacterial TSP3 repeat
VFDEIGGTTTTRVSVSSSGNQSNGGSRWPSVSTDGRVAFGSGASNLVPGDTNGFTDVFTHDIATGQTSLVSVDSQGQEGNDHSGPVGVSPPGISISADGRFVAFDSRASNLVAGDTNICGPPLRAAGPCEDIFVHDIQSGLTERDSVDSSGNQGNNESSAAAISADGRYVAFESMASNLVANDTLVCDFNGFRIPCLDIFLHDRQTGGTVRISEGMGGAEANDTSLRPAVAAGGRVVSFYSEASNLVPNDGNFKYDVFSVELNDNDTDGLLDPFDPDDDNDGFSDVVEVSAGTNPLSACGVDAWPPDINNDGFVDVIGDISRVTAEFGKSVPPAPARYDIGPDPPDHFIDVIGDITRLTGLFGRHCT